MRIIRGIFKFVLIVAAAALFLFAILLVWLTVTEYTPAETESVEFSSGGLRASPDDELSVIAWNIGYGGLGADEEFMMDGGRVRHPSEAEVDGYLSGIKDVLSENAADIYMLQEVDSNSVRTYGKDERDEISSALGLGYSSALNYRCSFVPLPVPVMGRIESGLLTLTGLDVTGAERVQLPVPFTWPSRLANLKRCLLVERVALDGTDAELVVVNLHMEAYDNGEGKLAQTEMLMGILTEEYEKGNYVIAGGDWNQSFPDVDQSVTPVLSEEYWKPGLLDKSLLPEGWHYAVDGSAPSCRLLNMPYTDDPSVMQYYIIDGFLLSPNVELSSVETLDYGFLYSDHQPVMMKVRLLEQ